MGKTECGNECITQRALQIFIIVLWVVNFFFAHIISVILFYYLIFHTRFWIFPIIYLIWLITDLDTPEKGGRRSDLVRNWSVWKYITEYFPIKLETTCTLTPDRNYIMIGHPHGIFALSYIMMFGNDLTEYKKKIPGFEMFIVTLKLNFMFPLHRDLFMGMGGITSSWKSLVHVLNNNKNPAIVGIIPGGSKEALYSKPNTYRLNLKNKYGFIKLALMTGTSLVPIFGFGEVDIYDQMNNGPNTYLYKIQTFLLKLIGVGFCIFHGEGLYKNYFRIKPYRAPVTIVAGEPIDVPKIENPTRDEVQKYHEIYIEKLKHLFYTNREKYIQNSENVDLIID